MIDDSGQRLRRSSIEAEGFRETIKEFGNEQIFSEVKCGARRGHLAGDHINTDRDVRPDANQTSQQQTQNKQSQQNQTSVQKPIVNVSPQNLSAQEILSKIFHFMLPNLPFNIADKQIIEYSIITAAILILIIVIASSKKSKTRKQIRK